MSTITAFFWGLREFRSDLTRHYDRPRDARAYDHGREWAHRLTLRHYDN